MYFLSSGIISSIQSAAYFTSSIVVNIEKLSLIVESNKSLSILIEANVSETVFLLEAHALPEDTY